MKFENIPLRVPNVEKIKKQFNLFKEVANIELAKQIDIA